MTNDHSLLYLGYTCIIKEKKEDAVMYGAILGDIIGSRFEFDRGGKTKDFELLTIEPGFSET